MKIFEAVSEVQIMIYICKGIRYCYLLHVASFSHNLNMKHDNQKHGLLSFRRVEINSEKKVD